MLHSFYSLSTIYLFSLYANKFMRLGSIVIPSLYNIKKRFTEIKKFP